jgi:hypothetical protein
VIYLSDVFTETGDEEERLSTGEKFVQLFTIFAAALKKNYI